MLPQARDAPPQGKAGREIETPPQQGERRLNLLPPEGWRKPETPPQQDGCEAHTPPWGSPNQGNAGVDEALRWSRRKPEAPP